MVQTRRSAAQRARAAQRLRKRALSVISVDVMVERSPTDPDRVSLKRVCDNVMASIQNKAAFRSLWTGDPALEERWEAFVFHKFFGYPRRRPALATAPGATPPPGPSRTSSLLSPKLLALAKMLVHLLPSFPADSLLPPLPSASSLITDRALLTPFLPAWNLLIHL